MKISHFLTALISFFLIQTLPAKAQTVQIKGVVIEEIPVKEGKIIIYLPKDIRPGDVISGTVTAEPSGDNQKERNRNRILLQQYKLNIGPAITPVSRPTQPIKFIITEFKPTIIALSDDKTVEITSIPVYIIKDPLPVPAPISIPTHALTGSTFRITGPFDGDASNTKCSIDGKPMEIMAESPRQTIVTMPPTTSGPHTITIQETGKTTEQQINAVNLNMAVDKSNLRTGQKAIVIATISGLQNLPGNATLSLSNASTGTVNLIGGNTQTINITASQVNSTGTYTQTFTVQSLTTGNFTVNADLELPEPGNSTAAISNHFIACPAANGLLLRQQECERLTSLINQSSKPPRVSTASSIPPAQLQTTVQGGNYHFIINPVADAAITAVTWTVSSPTVKNNLLRSDTAIKGNSSGMQLPGSSFNGAVHDVQATVYTTASAPITLSYTVIKNTGTQLYTAISPTLDELERQRAQAQSRADGEWAEQDAAQRERDRLINQVSQAEKNNTQTTAIATALENLDLLISQSGPMYQAPMEQLMNSLAEVMRDNPESRVNWKERCASWEEKMIDCHGQISSLSEELARLNNAMGKMKPGKGLEDAKKKKKEIEDMLKALPPQCDEIVKQLEICRQEQAKATVARTAKEDYEWEIQDLCTKIMKLFGQLQDWCKAHRTICNVNEKLDELAKNCPPKNQQQFQQYWNTIQQIISYKQTIEETYVNQAETTAAQIAQMNEEISRQDSIANAQRDSVWKYGTQADGLRQQIEDETRRQNANATQAQKERQKKLRTDCAEFLKAQMKKENVSPGLLQALAGIKDEIEQITSVLSGGATATDGLAIYNQAKNKKALAKKLRLLKGRLTALMSMMESGGELLGNIQDLVSIIDNIQALIDSKDDALTDAKKFGAILSSLNILLNRLSKEFPILEFFTAYMSYLTEGYNNAVNGATQIGITIVQKTAQQLVAETDCPQMVDEYGKNKSIDDVVKMLMERFKRALANNGVAIEPYNKTQLQLLEEELKKAILKKMLDCCLKWVTTER